MPTYHAEVSAVINAAPQKIYQLLADYKTWHPKILPKPYFVSLTVEKGGRGAGTVFSTQMKVSGATTEYRMLVTEPEPGRILAETDEEKGVHTTFTLLPVNSSQTFLTIATDARARTGLGGVMERLFAPMVMKRIYRAELALIADAVKNLPMSNHPGSD